MNKSDWICHTCYKSNKKGKIPVQVQATNLELTTEITELDELYPIGLMSLSQTIPFSLLFQNTKMDNRD